MGGVVDMDEIILNHSEIAAGCMNHREQGHRELRER